VRSAEAQVGDAALVLTGFENRLESGRKDARSTSY